MHLEQVRRHLQVGGQQGVVGVQAADVPAAGGLDAVVAVVPDQVAPLPKDHRDLGQLLLQASQRLWGGPVRRAAVDDDDLDAVQRLVQDRADGLFDVAAVVEAGDDHADQGVVLRQGLPDHLDDGAAFDGGAETGGGHGRAPYGRDALTDGRDVAAPEQVDRRHHAPAVHLTLQDRGRGAGLT